MSLAQSRSQTTDGQTLSRTPFARPRSARAIRVALAAAVAVVIAHGARPAHAQASAVVERAYQTLSSEDKMVMAWVYPTTTSEGPAACTWAEAWNGFELSCRFAYVDADGTRSARRLVFGVNRAGLITGIRDGGGRSVVPAFFWLRLTQDLVRRMAQDELARSPQTDSEGERALLKLFADGTAEPEDALRFLLNLKILASR